jgi:putative metallohydrolase (TIGR04338 family)
LPGLDACAHFVDKVVGSLWWHERFPERDLGGAPRLRPGNGARQAFYREEADGPTITLPRRYRTKAVVLHELSHWALGIDSGLPHHGRTFARVLLDAVHEFLGPERGSALGESYREHGVHVAKPARRGPDGRLHYGWDERLRLGKGRLLRVSYRTEQAAPQEVTARFEGYERGSSVLRFADGSRVVTNSVWAVADVEPVGLHLEVR